MWTQSEMTADGILSCQGTTISNSNASNNNQSKVVGNRWTTMAKTKEGLGTSSSGSKKVLQEQQWARTRGTARTTICDCCTWTGAEVYNKKESSSRVCGMRVQEGVLWNG